MDRTGRDVVNAFALMAVFANEIARSVYTVCL